MSIDKMLLFQYFREEILSEKATFIAIDDEKYDITTISDLNILNKKINSWKFIPDKVKEETIIYIKVNKIIQKGGWNFLEWIGVNFNNVTSLILECGECTEVSSDEKFKLFKKFPKSIKKFTFISNVSNTTDSFISFEGAEKTNIECLFIKARKPALTSEIIFPKKLIWVDFEWIKSYTDENYEDS